MIDERKKMSNGNAVTKATLVDEMLAPVPDVTRADAIRVVDNIVRGITEGLLKDHEVKISGFGKFVLQNKEPRMGRNPRTGEPMLITARRVLKFQTSDILRDQLNEDLSQ